MPSWAISMDSIATLFCVAFMPGPDISPEAAAEIPDVVRHLQVGQQHDDAVATLAVAFANP